MTSIASSSCDVVIGSSDSSNVGDNAIGVVVMLLMLCLFWVGVLCVVLCVVL
eukprot:COSAG05_NODE_1324_length_5186_cov_10.020244_2_plen_52_part_00